MQGLGFRVLGILLILPAVWVRGSGFRVGLNTPLI